MPASCYRQPRRGGVHRLTAVMSFVSEHDYCTRRRRGVRTPPWIDIHPPEEVKEPGFRDLRLTHRDLGVMKASRSWWNVRKIFAWLRNRQGSHDQDDRLLVSLIHHLHRRADRQDHDRPGWSFDLLRGFAQE